jgi:hypothetical protein
MTDFSQKELFLHYKFIHSIMIQRIQTIWLSVLSILSVSLIRGGIIQFSPGDSTLLTLGFKGITKDTGGTTEVLIGSVGLPLTIVLIAILGISAIFLYRNIKLQKTVTLLVIAFSLCLLIMAIYYWYYISQKFNGVPIPGFKMAFPPVILVLAIMAYRGMVKDERLLKSYDRLR